MIWESRHWKEPLIESAAAFEDFAQHAEISEENLVKVEKDVFIGFYSIRKLMDTMTISDSTKNLKLVLTWHPKSKMSMSGMPIALMSCTILESHTKRLDPDVLSAIRSFTVFCFRLWRTIEETWKVLCFLLIRIETTSYILWMQSSLLRFLSLSVTITQRM
jgi:hypothetical protein